MPVFKFVNKSFFKSWSDEMAYILGFFAADGYITLNKRGANFWCIQITDKQLLESIRLAVNSEHKISIRFGQKNESDKYRLQIGSKEMCDDLRALGFKELKTKNMVVPKIPKKYLSHFVRGYFDGDGNVWVGYINKKRSTPTLVLSVMFTSCSDRFLRQLRDKLGLLGVEGGSLYNTKGNYSRLQFSTNDAWKIHDIMYNQSDLVKSGLFLNRKKQVFDKFSKLKSLRS